MRASVPLPARMLLALLLGSLAGCTGAAARRRAVDETDPATGLPRAVSSEPAPAALEEPATIPAAETDPGSYAHDDRFLALALTWGERVRGDADRLDLATGLSFHDRAPPRVVLKPLRDERLGWRVEREIVDGRRRAVIEINIEPLVVGRDDPDRVVLRALAAVAVETRAGAPAPAWFSRYAGLLAVGDVEDRLERAVHEAQASGRPLRVNPDDPEDAEATALGAALLLAERSTPVDARRLMVLAADGEDPGRLVARWIKDPSGLWIGAAREILEDAASRVERDVADDLRTARAALDSLGPAGLDRALAAAPPSSTSQASWIAEADALRLEAAARHGDLEGARAVLSRSPPDASVLGKLDDPGAYLLLASRMEAETGGNPERAWSLLDRFERDFPRHAGRTEALALMARLLARLPPETEARGLQRILDVHGAAGIDAATLSRRVRALLEKFDVGAAARFLEALGSRADADDLSDVRAEVDAAAMSPSPASREANRVRVDAWVRTPDAATSAAVVDGGAVAGTALAARLATLEPSRRRAGVRLLSSTVGFARAVSFLSPAWETDPDRMGSDLEVLAGEAGYADLRRAVEAYFPAVRTDARAGAEWERACLGLDPELLAADDGLLQRLQSPEFPVRKEAFESLLAHDPPITSPALLARFARDPAILLRRVAVRAAGRAGLVPVVRDALEDPAWIVRQAACAAVVDARAYELGRELASLLRKPDPDEHVQAAAASALLWLASKQPRWIRPVVSIVRVGSPALAEGIASSLSDLSSPEVSRALVQELRLEALGREARADRAVLFRLFVAYGRASKTDPGYDPSLSLAEVRAIVAALPVGPGSARVVDPTK